MNSQQSKEELHPSDLSIQKILAFARCFETIKTKSFGYIELSLN